MGSPCLFTRQQALKIRYFYWLHVKNSSHHTELSLGHLKDTEFYLESKASFIHMSSIASFNPFLIAWVVGILHFFGKFHESSESFSEKIHVLLSNFFFFE